MRVTRLEKHQSAEIGDAPYRTPAARGRCAPSFILPENLDLSSQSDVSAGRFLLQFSPFPPTSTRSHLFRPRFTEVFHRQSDRVRSSSSGGCYGDTCVRRSAIHLPACGVPLRNRNQSEPASRRKGQSAMRMRLGDEEGLFQARNTHTFEIQSHPALRARCLTPNRRRFNRRERTRTDGMNAFGHPMIPRGIATHGF
jgi:hypothetical protein